MFEALTATASTEPKPPFDRRAFLLMHSCSPAMQAVERAVANIAPTNIPVLLVGESGTGKEFLAQQIHELSTRRNRTLTRVICASSNGQSLAAHFESDGVQGGEAENRSGTLFLKEISELDLLSQRSFLYCLPETNHGNGAGDRAPRLISSTALNLEDEVHAGRFRTELYYRINGVSLRLPALRERIEDIPALAQLFLAKQAASLRCAQIKLDARDTALLQELSWPGNIRELENVMKKIAILNDPKAVFSELLAGSTKLRSTNLPSVHSSLKTATRAASRGAERQLILGALNRTRWNRKRAAQELQISYKSLLYKLKLIGVEEPDKI
jgi:two-component system, NtrC family, response regulator AtoC